MTKQELGKKVDEYSVNRNGRSRRSKVLSILSSIVVFCITYALILPALTWERTLICEKSEHTHTDSCYTEVQIEDAELITCKIAEHTHGEGCYSEPQLICELPESEGHTHGEGCYAEDGTLICTESESEGHIHTDACYTSELICELPEHTHGDECREVIPAHMEKMLTCTLEEHTHGDSCFDAPPADADGIYCGYSEHKHSESCGTACTLTEHTHTKQCYSNPRADLESAKTWEAEIAELPLTGCWNEDVVVIAESQIGNRESERNYIVSDNGSINGYNRYGAWYGSPYADWCAMFCSFCLHYAGIDTMSFPQAASCPRWVEILSSKEYDLYRPAAIYMPQPGDLVFFDYDSYTDESEREANHVGIVTGLIQNENGGLTGIRTVEGNTASGVSSNTYDINNKNILGYAELPQGPILRKLKAVSRALTSTVDAWKEVSEIDDPTANYIIVSSSGYAMGVSGSNALTSARIEFAELGNHPGYYLADVNDNLQWKFSDVGTSAKLTNADRTGYGLRLSNNTIISAASNETTNTLNYSASGEYWRISYRSSYSTYYLVCNTDGTFSRNTSATNSNMKIYKAVKLDIGSGGHEDTGSVVKPTYPDYRDTSAEKTGSTALGEISGTYWSDASTSQIESLFEGIADDDGRVMADKSVIYGDDDYDAFESYEPNTFGVELSALGQKYAITDELEVKAPLDVVFVLDTSGSMIATTYNGVTSANILIESLNKIMKDVMDANEDNRVGVVCFSGCAHKLLDLGRYTAANDKYFPEGGANDNEYDLSPSASIQRTDGTLFRGTFSEQWGGTFTQDGIALGAQEFFDTEDTTLTKTVTAQTDEGTLNVTYTVTRRPLIILLSDGEPTYCTSDYDHVLESSNVYGNGNTGYYSNGEMIPDTTTDAANNKGVLGYYTILTAKNYKDRIAEHYNADAFFYTIGVGMSEDEDNSYEESVAGDDYKRAVLNPTPENINHLLQCTSATCLSSNITGTNRNITSRIDSTCRMLYRLLHNTQTGTTVRIASATDSSHGIRTNGTQANVPIVSNPYLMSDYSYADGAFFTVNNSVDTLTNAFSQAISYTDSFPVYGFILRSNTPMTVSDTIGDGMEIKSEPVLRYGGENFYPTSHETVGNVTTYHYSGTWTATDGSGQVADLSEITSTVTTDENGRQTVALQILDSQLPTYTPNLRNDGSAYFYYEQLPVRLIYQVGLTDEAVSEVLAMNGTGQSKTFYTNAWTQEDVLPHSAFTPTRSNPYYQDDDYDKEPVSKDHNNTGTLEDAWRFTDDSDKNYVSEIVGNNGKLTFESEKFDVVLATIRKVDSNGNPITTDTATFALYSDAALTQLVNKFKTDSHGELTIPALRANRTYYLKEIEAPYGYELYDTVISFSVDVEGNAELDATEFYRVNAEDGAIEVLNEDGHTFVEAEKQWSGELAEGESYPDSALIQLYADGRPIQSAVTLNADNEWYYIWEDLPILSEADKHEIVYTVGELEIPDNYIASITQDENGAWIVTNHKIKTTSLSVYKKWKGGEADAVFVELLRNGEQTGRFAKLSAENDWYFIWDDLPDYDVNGPITYSVREVIVDGYNSDVHLWTGEDDPYGMSGSKDFVQQTGFKTGEQYVLTFQNYWDDNTDYPIAVLASNIAHNGLTKHDFAEIEEPTPEMLWTASVASNGQITFTNVGANKQLVLDNNNKVALGSASNCHDSAWEWTTEEHGNALLAQYTTRLGLITRTHTYYFQVMGIQNGVGDASSEGRYVPLVPYSFVDTVVQDDVEKGDAHYIIVNTKNDYEPPDLDLTLRKISSEPDAGGEPIVLSGARFTLYIETGDVADGQIPGTNGRLGRIVQEIECDGTSQIKLTQDGTYYLYENTPPEGYLPLEEAICFKVDSTVSTRTATIENHPLLNSGTTVTAFDIPNTPEDAYVLPETGGAGTNPIYTIGFLLLAGAVMCGLLARRKRERRQCS